MGHCGGREKLVCMGLDAENESFLQIPWVYGLIGKSCSRLAVIYKGFSVICETETPSD